VVDEIVTDPSALSDRTFDCSFQTHEAIGLAPHQGQYPDLGDLRHPPFVGGYFLKPEREYNVDMIRQLGFKGCTPPLYVSMRRPVSGRDTSVRHIAIVPGGNPLPRWKNKRWPYFTELTAALLSEYSDVQIYIVGTSHDHYENPGPRSSRVVDLRGQHSLSETAWLLRHCAMAIGNDCGPMHIADAIQTTSLVLFGPSCELKNGPLYKAIPVSADVVGRPCQYDMKKMEACDNPVCITELHMETVLHEARKHLDGTP